MLKGFFNELFFFSRKVFPVLIDTSFTITKKKKKIWFFSLFRLRFKRKEISSTKVPFETVFYPTILTHKQKSWQYTPSLDSRRAKKFHSSNFRDIASHKEEPFFKNFLKTKKIKLSEKFNSNLDSRGVEPLTSCVQSRRSTN